MIELTRVLPNNIETPVLVNPDLIVWIQRVLKEIEDIAGNTELFTEVGESVFVLESYEEVKEKLK